MSGPGRAAVLLALGTAGAAAAWVATRGGLPDLRQIVGLPGGAAAPPLALPAPLRPHATAPRLASTALTPSFDALKPRELASGLDGVEDLAFSSDGRFLASAGYGDYSIRIWDVTTGEPVQAVRTHRRPKSLAALPDGKALLVADVYGNLRRFPWHDSGKLGWARAWNLEGTLGAEIAMSPDGRTLASGAWHAPEKGELVLLAVEDARVLSRATLPVGLRRPAFSPSGRWLAVGDAARSFALWDLQSGEGRVHLVPKVGAQSDVASVAFSHDEGLLATGHMDSSITIWNLPGPRQRHDFYVPESSTWRVAFSPAHALLATAQQSGGIHLWDPASARQLTILRGHAKNVREICWSADGRRLASAGEDGRILLWDIAPAASPTPAPVATPPAPAETAQTEVPRLLGTVRAMQEIPAEQRRALGEAADRWPQMSDQERAAFAATLALIASSRELGRAMASSLESALREAIPGAAGAASDLGLESAFLDWNLEGLPEAKPIVDGLKALSAGDRAAIEAVLTAQTRERFAALGFDQALAEMRSRWEAIRAAVGQGPVHLTFVGTPTQGEIYFTSSSADLSTEGVGGSVDLPAVPVVKEEGAWRIGAF